MEGVGTDLSAFLRAACAAASTGSRSPRRSADKRLDRRMTTPAQTFTFFRSLLRPLHRGSA